MNICSFHKSRYTLRLGHRLFLIVTECFGVFLGIIFFFFFLLFKIYFGFYTYLCVRACAHTPKPMCTLHVCQGTHVDVRGQLLGVVFFHSGIQEVGLGGKWLYLISHLQQFFRCFVLLCFCDVGVKSGPSGCRGSPLSLSNTPYPCGLSLWDLSLN